MSRSEKGWLLAGCMAVAPFIAALFMPNVDHVGAARFTKARLDIQAFHTALEAYRQDTGVYPTESQGLRALRENPDVKGWSGPYLQQDVPQDPWGHEYVYRYSGGPGEKPGITSSKPN